MKRHPWFPQPSHDKEDRFQRVSFAIIATLLESRPDAIRVAQIARRANVSRPWIYKYFGADREALIHFAVAEFGNAFFEMSRTLSFADVDAWRQHLEEGTRRGFHDTVQSPWCLHLYFRYRLSPCVVGHSIRQVESRYLAKFVDDMPSFLKQVPNRPDAFASLFTSVRASLYFYWCDEAFRAAHTEDEMVSWCMHSVDRFLDASS